ncbi:glutathione S-transferase family protein [Sphingoaurantiacus capsulatus]|uniref:Glutathione S-transferase family protein n=1 Tax=Sphingoaurantiacus capsulatus TaxID=1771310 RepID=A0ABV7X639_9SPHN
MLILWGRLNSHNVKKVAWLAEELGLPYERRDIGGKFGFTDAYLAMNPNRLIPTIEDGDVVLWESNAILRYLGSRYGGDAFWPADPATRAVGDKWMDWMFSFADAQRDAFINLVRRPEGERDRAAVAASAKVSGAMMARLEAALAKTGWLSGERFGLGDIPMGVYAHTFFTLPIDRPALPAVEDWYRRLTTRPGYAANVMIPLT